MKKNMLRKRDSIITGVFVLFAGSSMIFGIYFLKKSHPDNMTAIIGGEEFSLEIARTPQEKARGLSGRKELCDSCGMLFLFENSGKYGFWMKEMQFPLDIFWLRNGIVVHSVRNAEHTDQKTIYEPDVATDAVLEVNAGIAEKYGITVGAKIIIE